MNPLLWADSFFGLLIQLLWQTSLLFLVAWGLNRWVFPKASAQVRYLVWMLVLLRFFLPVSGWINLPASSSAAGFFFLSEPALPLWLTEPIPRAQANAAAESAYQEAASQNSNSMTAAPVGSMAPAAENSFSDSDSPDITWRQGLFLAWCGLVLFFLGWLGAQISRQRQVIRTAEPAPPSIAEAGAGIQAALGIRKPVPVLISSQTGAPMAVGLFRPVILLPPLFQSGALSGPVVEQVLLHEYAHIRRRDLPVQAGVALLKVLFFFHPVVWLTSRHLEIERELATDDWVVSQGGSDPMNYARSLLDVAENLSAPLHGAALSMGLSESARRLKVRLLRIQTGRTVRPRTWQILPMAALLTCMVAFSPAPAEEAATPSAAEETAAPAEDAESSIRTDILAFIEAMKTADYEAAKPFFLFEAPIDQEVMKNLFTFAREKIQDAPEEDQVALQLVGLKPLSEDRVFVCLWGKAPMLDMNEPVPLFLMFEKDEGKWKTAFLNWTTILDARELGPTEMGRRSITANMIRMRYGTPGLEKALESQRVRTEWMKQLAKPPYSFEPFASIEEQLDQQLEQYQAMLESGDWRKKMEDEMSNMPEEMLPKPTDYPLMFYIESSPDDPNAIEIPYAEGVEEGTFRAKRFPVMTLSSVRSAAVEMNRNMNSPMVGLILTRGGKEIFSRVTEENIGKKVAIVFEGKVISAPMIRDRISGGRAQISGRFTREEAERIAEVLNERERKGRKLIEMIRQGGLLD
jgi:beta-lactamase regulating signal transducer with metallopeptidase domain